jgi:hypothetical protein
MTLLPFPEIHIGGLVMIYAVLAILAIMGTAETKHANLEEGSATVRAA